MLLLLPCTHEQWCGNSLVALWFCFCCWKQWYRNVLHSIVGCGTGVKKSDTECEFHTAALSQRVALFWSFLCSCDVCSLCVLAMWHVGTAFNALSVLRHTKHFLIGDNGQCRHESGTLKVSVLHLHFSCRDAKFIFICRGSICCYESPLSHSCQKVPIIILHIVTI